LNREIKFRAWDTDNQCFFVPTYEAHLGNLKDISITLQGDILRRTLEMSAEHVPANKIYILQQYTGLKDRNGKEIYEGDLLGADWLTHPVAVKWHELGHWVVDGRGWDEHLCTYKDIEVIGNIYKNPEVT